MKKILIILFFIPFFMQAQNIPTLVINGDSVKANELMRTFYLLPGYTIKVGNYVKRI